MNSIPKFVASTTLQKLDWSNSSLIRDVATEVQELKEQAGHDILVFGSITLVDALMEQGLIDEYRLLVYPVVLGKGLRHFKEGRRAKMKLVESKTCGNDVVLLRYRPAG
jgi:dihydrofolate reductase